jgi:ribosomal protein S18 acetylase RimI-like enzyme
VSAFPDPSEDGADVRALHANLIEHYRLHDRLSASEFHAERDVVWYLSGRSVNFLNAVMSASFTPTDAGRRVDEVLAPFQERGVPMRWWTDERGIPGDVNGELERRGLELAWDVPGMTVDLDRGLREHAGVEVDVRRVESRAELHVWFGAFAAGFGFEPAAAQPWLHAFEELGFGRDDPLRHYTAFVGGEPVATATMHVAAGAAGVYHVGTRPDARGRGYGSAVTLVPLLEARREDVRWGVLKASHLGRSIYERLGFAERARLRQYRWWPPQDAAD